VKIERDDYLIFPILLKEIIKASDILVFSGQTDEINELRKTDHLVLKTDHAISADYFNHGNTMLLETVITRHIRKHHLTIKELRFREKYNSVVIGIIRNGERLQGKIGSIQPKLDDILLFIADKNITGFIEKDTALTIVSSEERKIIQHTRKSFYPFIAFIATILLVLIFNLNILHTALIGVAFMFVANRIQIKESLSMVEYKKIISISTSFVIGKALTNTGTAAFVARILGFLLVDYILYFY